MDFKTTQKKCLNNNWNTFCNKKHYLKYEKNELGTCIILNISDFIDLWRHHKEFVIARCNHACPRQTMCIWHQKLERLTGYVEYLRNNNLNYEVIIKKVALLYNENSAETQQAFWWFDIVEIETGNVPQGATLRWRAQFC